jgi:hypothetical protein
MLENLKVQEVPGLYGKLKIDEKTIQKIWAEQNHLNTELTTECGNKLKILSSGKWNLSEEGPDFKDASILLDDKKITGDIEIHFHREDWNKHYHHKDSNYNRVVLHVVLFPSKSTCKFCLNEKGKKIPTLTLLKCLRKSIEEILEFEVLKSLAGYKSILPPHFDSLESLNQIKEMNVKLARDRWKQKQIFAEKRLTLCSTEDTFHKYFLEVLGYRRNRIQMNELAEVFPPNWWKKNDSFPNLAYNSISDWKIRGVRPANHPKLRLEQYSKIWKSNPNWINSLLEFEIQDLPLNENTNRKNLKIAKINQKWKKELGDFIGGSRLNTLWIDACLPLLSLIHKKDYFATWFFWYYGDFPITLKNIASEAGISNRSINHPLSNGHLQGILEYCIKKNILG